MSVGRNDRWPGVHIPPGALVIRYLEAVRSVRGDLDPASKAYEHFDRLLDYVDRMECYLAHDAGCPKMFLVPAQRECDCGLSQLMVEMYGVRDEAFKS